MDQEAKWGVTSVKYIKQGWQENFPVALKKGKNSLKALMKSYILTCH